MIYRSAKEHYEMGGHDNWTRSKELIEKLLVLDGAHKGALILLMKIQVRLNIWREAGKTLDQVKARLIPERYFLEGFMLWKQQKHEQAIPHFRTAIRLRQQAIEIYHALAICLFRTNKLEEAQRTISEGLSNRPRPNILLIDLAALIAIAQNNLVEAERYVEQLRRLNAGSDFHHRKATLLNAKKRPLEALPHAREALKGARQRFEVESNLANILIESQHFDEADLELGKLDAKYKKEASRTDVRLGLRIKLLLRRGNWQEAEPLWVALEEKNSPVHLGLRRDLLEQKLRSSIISPQDRDNSERELLGLIEIIPTSADVDPMLQSELEFEGEEADDQ